MHKMTERNLSEAFAGESQAFMKYSIWAEKAEQEGMKGVARLFRAIAQAEKVHATNHFRALGMIKTSKENLNHAMEGEVYEVDEMYPSFQDVAIMQDEKAAAKSMHYAIEAEKIHAAMYKKALSAVESGKDIQVGDVYVCPVCGYTVEGGAPDKCPICGVAKERFQKY